MLFGKAFLYLRLKLIVMSSRHIALSYWVFAIIKTCTEVGVLPSAFMLGYNNQGCVFYPQLHENQKLKANNTKPNQTNKVVEWKYESNRVSVWNGSQDSLKYMIPRSILLSLETTNHRYATPHTALANISLGMLWWLITLIKNGRVKTIVRIVWSQGFLAWLIRLAVSWTRIQSTLISYVFYISEFAYCKIYV